MNSNSEGASAPKKSKHRDQKYRKEWEKNENFKNWLSPVLKDNYLAMCRVCNSTMKADITTLKRHSENPSHKNKLLSVGCTQKEKFQAFFSQPIETPLDVSVKEAEIKLSGFVAEHNIPFLAMDDLTAVLKDCFPDSKIARNLQLKRTKCTAIVKNVIGKCHKQELNTKLKNTKFSVLTDESTDISATKTSCIVVRFFNPESNSVESKFWELTPIFDDPTNEEAVERGACAEVLYNKLISSFTSAGIPLENIIGFASDGCNVIMGCRNSVASRLKENFAGITIIKCVCHSLHLCSSEACKKLPRHCEDLARDIYNHFKSSCKRQAEFLQFQMFVNVDVHKILHPSQTRWLSLGIVVKRTLEQWEALKMYFNNKWIEERLISVENIAKYLNDPQTKMFYLFLDWVLPKFNKANEMFQTENVIIVNMHERMIQMFQELLLMYMDRSYVVQTHPHLIDPKKEEKYLPLSAMYLGVEVLKLTESLLARQNQSLVEHFKERCREFLITSCSEIQKRYNFDDALLPKLSLLTVQKALSHEERINTPTILPLATLVPRISNSYNLQELDDEWRQLPFENFTDEIKSLETDRFWGKLKTYTHLDNERRYEKIANFALDILSLPHSNADCERIFSKVNLIKTKQRNKLITKTIDGCILASQAVKEKKKIHKKFHPTLEMITSMNNKNLYEEEKASTSSESSCPNKLTDLYNQDIGSGESDFE